MRMHHKFLRNGFFQPFFNRIRGLALGQTQPVADPEDMRIHRHGRLTKGDVENHIGGFSSNTGQGL